jgi:hypothetical protein
LLSEFDSIDEPVTWAHEPHMPFDSVRDHDVEIVHWCRAVVLDEQHRVQSADLDMSDRPLHVLSKLDQRGLCTIPCLPIGQLSVDPPQLCLVLAPGRRPRRKRCHERRDTGEGGDAFGDGAPVQVIPPIHAM